MLPESCPADVAGESRARPRIADRECKKLRPNWFVPGRNYQYLHSIVNCHKDSGKELGWTGVNWFRGVSTSSVMKIIFIKRPSNIAYNRPLLINKKPIPDADAPNKNYRHPGSSDRCTRGITRIVGGRS